MLDHQYSSLGRLLRQPSLPPWSGFQHAGCKRHGAIFSNSLLENIGYYMPFFPGRGQLDYTRLAESVREPGLWTGVINDAVPLATANILHTKLRIFYADHINLVYPWIPLCLHNPTHSDNCATGVYFSLVTPPWRDTRNGTDVYSRQCPASDRYMYYLNPFGRYGVKRWLANWKARKVINRVLCEFTMVGIVAQCLNNWYVKMVNYNMRVDQWTYYQKPSNHMILSHGLSLISWKPWQRNALNGLQPNYAGPRIF